MGQACADAGSWTGFVGGLVRLDYDSGSGVLVAELVATGIGVATATAAQWVTLRDYARAGDEQGFGGAASVAWASVWGQLSTGQRQGAYAAAQSVADLAVGVKLRHHDGAAQIDTSSPGLALGDGAALWAGTTSQVAFDTAVAGTTAGAWYAAQGGVLRAAMRQMVIAAG